MASNSVKNESFRIIDEVTCSAIVNEFLTAAVGLPTFGSGRNTGLNVSDEVGLVANKVATSKSSHHELRTLLESLSITQLHSLYEMERHRLSIKELQVIRELANRHLESIQEDLNAAREIIAACDQSS